METSVGRTTIKARDVRLASELTQRTNESPAKLICRRPESRKQSFNGATDELQPTDSTGLSLNILHSPRRDVRNARADNTVTWHRDIDNSTEEPMWLATTFSEVWNLLRFNIDKVTFKVTQGHR